MHVNHTRLLAELRRLAEFGKVETGVHRLSFSPDDRAARQWLVRRMEDAGLAARIDGIGNVYGQTPGVAKAVLIGSHTDSVPNGGWLDGALGVLYGLEVARARLESSDAARVGVDVISFADEEGTFRALAGSLSFCGQLSDHDIDAARDRQGRYLREVLSEAGYAGRRRATIDPARHVAYLEGHIEQGPCLEAAGKQIGVVTAIVGIRRYLVTCTGRADHAGTTPMHLRKDAGSSLIRYCFEVLQRFERVGGPESVWNIGQLSLEPGAGNVVPSRAAALIEFRDSSIGVLDCMEAELNTLARDANGRSGVSVEAERLVAIDSAEMQADLVAAVETAAQACGATTLHMPSGAGHDAMVVSRAIPAGMLFIPSIGGRSHDVAEDTAEADIRRGADVLAATVAILAKESDT